MTSQSADQFFRNLPPYRRWYRFGTRSPVVLWKRLGWHPIFRARMTWQRARRGWSVEDVWSFDHYLAGVISGGVAHMREIAHGYPDGVTYDEWLVILAEIEQGMEAALDNDHGDWAPGGEEAFDRAMGHLHKWWFALWD